MNSFNQVSCPVTALERVLELVGKNGGILASYGYSFDCPDGQAEQVEGFRLSLCNTNGMGNYGSYVAVATNARTYQYQLDATIKIFRQLADEASLDAEKWNWSKWTVELGGGHLIPVKWSLCSTFRGTKWGEDEKWSYHAYSEGNYLNVGKDTNRVWVKPR
jgi:hypothetical protein